jgi:hypothetical protein
VVNEHVGREPRLGRIRRLPARARDTFRDSGPRSLFWRSLALAGVRRLHFYDRTDLDAPAASIGGVNVRNLAAADLDAYRALQPDPQISDEEFLRRLRSGDICLGAWQDDRLVATRWMATKEARIPYLGVSFLLSPGAVYGYESYAAPAVRRRGIHRLITSEMAMLMRSMGRRSCLSAVLPENLGGVAISSPHARLLGTISTIRIGPWLLTRSSVPSDLIGKLRPLRPQSRRRQPLSGLRGATHLGRRPPS